jgi:hypothetical protein
MRIVAITLAVWALAAAIGHAQILIGQTDNFQDGTTQGWQAGGTNPGPINVATGGPAGTGDRYLQIATNGAISGPGSRLAAFNLNQWVGNYSMNNITAIAMDMQNFNVPTPLSVRIAFKQGAGFSAPGYLSEPFLLPNDGQWHNVVFPLTPGQFSAVNSPGAFADVLSGTFSEFWIIHTVDVDFFGDSTAPVAAQLGIDNITAIPEPSSLVLVGFGVGGWAYRRRKKVSGQIG